MSKIQRWREVSRQLVFEKFGRKVEAVTFDMPDGSRAEFYIKVEKPAACVLALTSDNQIVMVRQYRPGPAAIIEGLPGGYIDVDEEPMAAVKRELLEETGYEAGELELVAEHLTDAYTETKRYCYVAKNCKKVSEPLQTSNEYTEAMIVSVDDFRIKLQKGQMTDVPAGYLTLDYLGLLK